MAAATAIRLGLADPPIPGGGDKPPAVGPQQR
jgi:hypothetical protein